MDNCIFCKIVSGALPSFKVSEDEDHLAFLSISPIKPGHTLVIPKKHSEYLFDMESPELSDLVLFSKSVADKLKNSMEPKTGKVGVMIAGLEVAHTHVHLIPMDSEGDLNFSNAKSATNEELQIIVDKISA